MIKVIRVVMAYFLCVSHSGCSSCSCDVVVVVAVIVFINIKYDCPVSTPTGKTVMLVLMGMRWLREGCDVHVVSTRPDCLAASRVIQHQLELTACITQGDSSVPSVHFHSYDMYKCEADLDRAISDLKTVSQCRQLRVLMDEAKFTNR